MSYQSLPGLFCALICVLCQAQAPPGLSVRVVDGAGAVVAGGAVSSRAFAVVAETAGGRPAAGATVTFVLPDEGVTGKFLSGFRRETVLTGADGRARVMGILWGQATGRAEVRVTAAWQGQRAETEMTVEVSAAPVGDRESRVAAGRSGARKWLILAGVAGGALAGVAMAGKGSPAAAPAAVATVATPPSIGAPSITIGRPQ